LVLLLLLFPTACQHFSNYFSPSTKTATEPKTIQEKFAALRLFADTLAAENIIAVHPEKFAGFMLCVFYAESNLNPKSNWDGQEGINQLTAATRRKLGMPENITHIGFLGQLQLFKKYLIATKQAKKVTRVYDLHILNFSPYKVGKDYLCKANPEKNLHYLDLDKDGDVTANDMRMFIEKRCKENAYIYGVFLTLK
jgi:hypothetical protein